MSALKVCSHEMDSLRGAAYEEVRREYYDLTRGIIDRLFDADSPGAPVDRHVATMILFGTLNRLYRRYDPSKDPSVSAVGSQIGAQSLHGIGHFSAADRRAMGSRGT